MAQPHCMVVNAGCKEAGEKTLDLFVDIQIYKMFSGFLPFYNTSFNILLDMLDDQKYLLELPDCFLRQYSIELATPFHRFDQEE